MKIDLHDNTESFVQSKRFTDWKKEFVKTDLYKKLEDKYDYIFDYWDFKFRIERSSFFSPRHYLVSKITGLVGFYLIENYLDTTEQIIDVSIQQISVMQNAMRRFDSTATVNAECGSFASLSTMQVSQPSAGLCICKYLRCS